MCALQLKASELQERLTTLELSESEARQQLEVAQAELSSARATAAEAESAISEAAGLRRALAEAERQMTGAGSELSELSRQLAEAKGQREASQVGMECPAGQGVLGGWRLRLSCTRVGIVMSRQISCRALGLPWRVKAGHRYPPGKDAFAPYAVVQHYLSCIQVDVLI